MSDAMQIFNDVIYLSLTYISFFFFFFSVMSAVGWLDMLAS